MEKVLVVYVKYQTNLNIPLSQNPIQSTVLALFNCMKAHRGEKLVKEKFKTSSGWFIKFKEGRHF